MDYMKKIIALSCLFFTQLAVADIFRVFRETDGSTNWQYIANFSSGIFIIALSLTIVRLFFSRRQSHRYNRELEEIKAQLELRVQERTATLRRSESYITEILSSMPLMLIGLNNKNKITQWNHRAEEISGVASADAIGKDLWKAYPDITVTAGQIAQALEQKSAVTIKYSQRGQYHFDITVYPLTDQTDTGVVILIDDVTQKVKSETMLIQRDKMSLMGEMASDMAHDINLPLREMLKSVRTVRQGLTDAPFDPVALKEILEDSVIRGQQARSVIENLMEFSSAGGDAKSQENIAEIIDHSIELAEDVLSITSGLRFQDIDVNVDYAENLPDFACYTTELQQVFLSLMRHACNSLGRIEDDNHKPAIRIAVTHLYDDLWIRFHHNGVMISPDDQQYLFESFATAGETNNQYETDQRLSFTHFIITEQHHGQIAVISDEDQGTTFSIQLPIK